MGYPRGIALFLTLALAGSVTAQSLAEVAAREKKRREAQKAATSKDEKEKTKTFTDADLQKYAGADSGQESSASPASDVAGSTDASAPGGSVGFTTSAGSGSGSSDPKRQRADAIKSQLAQCQASLTSARAAQKAAEEANPSVTTRNNPLDGTPRDMNQAIERAKETKERNVREARARVQQTEKQCADIEDMARREGIPAGWIR